MSNNSEFYREDRDQDQGDNQEGKPNNNQGQIAKTLSAMYQHKGKMALAAFVTAAGIYTMSDRVTDRQAALKIVRGALVNSNVETGLKPDAMLPQVEYLKFPKFLHKVSVSANKGDDITIRTSDKARVYGGFEVHFTIDNTHEDFGNIYNELKADEMSDLYPFIANYTVPAAIDVYKGIPATELNDVLVDTVDEDGNAVEGVTTRLTNKLQSILDDRGYGYINAHDVIPTGVGLSQEANDNLEKIVTEERKLDLLKEQGKVADAGLEVAKKQAAVTAAAYKKLHEDGVPERQLSSAYYAGLMRDYDSVGTPFVPGPVPGTGVGAVSVQPSAMK